MEILEIPEIYKKWVKGIDINNLKLYNNNCPYIAGWSSWQLVGLITRRSIVRVYPPQPAYSKSFGDLLFFILPLKSAIWGNFGEENLTTY